jgi:hypothetical protein
MLLGDTFEPHGNTVATEILVSIPYDGTVHAVPQKDILVSASPVDMTKTGKTAEYTDTDWKDCYLTFADVLELLSAAELSGSRLAGDARKCLILGMKGPAEIIPHMGMSLPQPDVAAEERI